MQLGLSTIITKQLLNDAPYEWLRRDQANYSPLYRRTQFEQLENRINGYLEAMLLHIQTGDELLSRIRMTDWGAVYITAYIALITNNEGAFHLAVDAIKDERQSRELRDALHEVPFETAKPFIHDIASHENPWVQVAVIRAVGHHFHEINPDWLTHHLKSKSAEVRVAVLRVIGDKGLVDHAEAVKSFFEHEEDSVRFQAAFSGNLLGIDGAYQAILPFCFSDNPYMRKALGVVHYLHDISAIKQAIPRIQNSQVSVRIKAYNIAMAGLIDSIPILLEWMQDPREVPGHPPFEKLIKVS